MCDLERIFLSYGMRVRRTHSCREACSALREPAPPSVTVTDLALPDGNWTNIVRPANAAPTLTAVIVVSRPLDVRLYLDVLDSGAHDFVVPPFSPSGLAYIIRGVAGRIELAHHLLSRNWAFPDLGKNSLTVLCHVPRRTDIH